jgi:hypothetical protein
MKKLTFIFGMGILVASCSPKTAEVADKVSEPEAMSFPNETVASGFKSYGSDCTKCHKAKEIKKYSREEWNKILPNMSSMAKIDDATQASIDTYINWELAR